MNITRSTLIGLFSASLLCLASPLLHAEIVPNATATVNAPTEDIDALKKSIYDAMDAKDWSQSLKLLDRYLTLEPDNAKAHRMRGSVLRELGQSDEAIAAYRKVTELLPQNANGWNGLCWTYLTLNRPLDGRAYCEKAVSLDKTNYAVLVNFGHTFLLAGDTKTAKHWYRETLLNIGSEDDLKQGPLADFDQFIGKGWKVKESRKAKAWFEKEGRARIALLEKVNKLLTEAKAAEEKKDYVSAIALREQHLPLLITLVGENHQRVTDAHKELIDAIEQRADQLSSQGNYAQALPLYRRVLAAHEKKFGSESSEAGTSLSNVADCLKNLKRYAEAEPLYIQALDIVQIIKGSDDWMTGIRLGYLAGLYESMGQYSRAEPLYVRALAISEKTNGSEHSLTGMSLNDLAGLYKATGQYARAEPLYVRALAISEKANGPDHLVTATRLNNLALLYRDMGQYASAEPLLIRALAISEKANGPEHPSTGISLNNLAGALKDAGRYNDAIPLLRHSLAILEKAYGREHINVATALNNLAFLLQTTGRYSEAENLYRRAQEITEKALSPTHPDVAIRYDNLAGLLETTGRYAEAESFFRRALAITEKALGSEHPDVAIRYNNLAVLLYTTGRYSESETCIRRALTITEKALGSEHVDNGATINNLAKLLETTGRYSEAEPFFRRALAIDEKSYAPDDPHVAVGLNNLAGLLKATGRDNEAEAMYLRAWRIVSIAHQPELTWKVQAYISAFYTKSHPDLAIWYGKQAVNTLQSVRANNTGLDKDTQKSFLQKNETTYKELADLLFGQGRLMEGQQVLAMLKESEYFDFIQRNNAADPRKTQAGFDGKEKPLADRYDKICGQLAALSREREALIKKAQLGLTASEQSRKEELDANLADARKAYDAFMVDLKREFTQSESVGRSKDERQEAFGEKNLASLRALQGTLRDLGHGAVTLHYLMTDKRLWILLTTPTVQLKRESAISEAELNKQIGAYREAIARRDPKVKELGKALYDIIIAPVAEDLKQADAQTLMLSLDGGLRYLPMAALYDGDKYLAQRYRLAIYTTAATSQLNVPPKANWNLAGFGLTRAVTVGEQSFNALTSVKGELEGIKQDMKGSVKLDQDFTAKTLQSGLESGTSVVHLASHFVFRPGNETDSFLLMGDGNPLSLAAIRDYTFTDVDLLTLSACETAVGGGKDANGREVEGFGVQAQEQGAKAVIASLWPVDDQSTGQFMQLLYGFRQQNPGMTKAEAMQKAQLAFIEGRIGPALAEVSRGAVRRSDGSKAAAASTSTDHPYYWAPFILMGNWL